MYSIYRASKFRKELKQLSRNPYFKKHIFLFAVKVFAKGKLLEPKYNNHKLTGKYLGYHECHLQPDILLIYKVDHDLRTLRLARIGSHSDLFR